MSKRAPAAVIFMKLITVTAVNERRWCSLTGPGCSIRSPGTNERVRNAPQLASAAVQLARAAIELLDLRQHAASHPRLGVVDHVSLQPAGLDSTLHAAAQVARAIGALSSDC